MLVFGGSLARMRPAGSMATTAEIEIAVPTFRDAANTATGTLGNMVKTSYIEPNSLKRVTYVENGFQASKAVLMGNTTQSEAILAARTGFAAKQAGRLVDLDLVRWGGAKSQAMRAQLFARFAQDAAALNALLATGDATIVEVSFDEEWGCGIDLAQFKVGMKVKRIGLQGDSLMAVRSAFAKGTWWTFAASWQMVLPDASTWMRRCSESGQLAGMPQVRPMLDSLLRTGHVRRCCQARR